VTNILHRITVEIKRGLEQEDSRWSFAQSMFKGSDKTFAFWDTKTTKLMTRDQVRPLGKQKKQATTKDGDRPGSQITNEFLMEIDDSVKRACRYPYVEDESVAAIRLVRRAQGATSKTVEKVTVVGESRTKTTGTEEVIDTTPGGRGIEVMMESNSFLLQGVNESFQEKFQISETFGEPILFMFGERQKIFQFEGLLFDTDSWAWKERFIDNYNKHLRGTKAVESGAFVTLITNSAVIQGFLLSCNIGQSVSTHGYVALSFAMFVQDRYPLAEIERSPQDQEKKEAEDPRVLLVEIQNGTIKPDAIVKTLNRTNGKIELPGGFFGKDFDQAPAVDKPTHWKPGGTTNENFAVNGLEQAIPLSMPVSFFYTPPDLAFLSAMPQKYQNQMMLGVLGRIGPFQRMDLQAPPGTLDPGGFSMGPFAAVAAPSRTSSSEDIFFHVGNLGGASPHSITQIERMKAIADKGNLSVDIYRQGSLVFQHRKVKEMRRPNGEQDVAFRSKGGGRFFGSVNIGTAFEIELDSPVIPSTWGLAQFTHLNNFRILIYEENQFLITSPIIRGAFHALTQMRMRLVGEVEGTSRALNSAARYVLTDPGATFQTDLNAHFTAGDKVTVVLPYQVTDEDAFGKPTSAEMPVVKVLSQTQLQLGLLTLPVVNKTSLPKQRIGEMTLPSYKVLVRKGTGLILIEEEIRKRIKNPPDGAFSKEDLNSPEQTLQQERGVFELVKDVHFKNP
jgi:hypothetical protein